MLYKIKPFQRYLARQIGVEVKPSTKGCYKMDVFDKEGKYLTSIGDRRYDDYLSYVENVGYDYAERRKELYWKRHKKDNVEGTRGWFALKILWS